jgi:hypothetical protein
VSILETNIELLAGGSTTPAERVQKRDAARAVLEEAGSDDGLALYWRSVGREAWFACRAEEASAAFERIVVHAENARAKRLLHEGFGWVGVAQLLGPTPAREATIRVEELLARTGHSILSEAGVGTSLGLLQAMQGEADRGRKLVAVCIETLREAGLVISAAGMSMGEAWAARYAGDVSGAEDVLRRSLTTLESLGDRGYLGTVALELAELLYFEGRYDEIEALCAIGRATTSPDDVINFVGLDELEGCLLARRGQLAEGEERVRRSVARADTTDMFRARGDTRVALASVLALAGKADEAAAEAAAGLSHFEAKGDISGAREARGRLSRFGVDIS